MLINSGMKQINKKTLNLSKSTNYKLNIQSLPNTTFWAKTVSIPSISANAAEIPNPMYGSTYIPSNTINWEPLNIEFMVDEDFSNYFELLDLIYKAANPDVTGRESDINQLITTGSLHVLSNNKNSTQTVFTFHNMFPTSLGEISFNNDSAEGIVCSATLQFDNMTYENKSN